MKDQRSLSINDFTAINVLSAFKNHLLAQSGKYIPEDLAGELIAQANMLIDALDGAT